jgi:hypothetical protein
MYLFQVFAALVLLPTLAIAQGDPTHEAKVDDPGGLLEVDSTVVLRFNGEMVSFNQGRRYAISVNKLIPDARTFRAKLAVALKEQKQLDQVVFDWFGKESLKRLNLQIGDKVPIPTVQAAISAFATESKLPVYIALATKDERLSHNYCVIVGGLVNRGKGPLMPEQIRELLKPGLTQDQLAKLLPKIED